MPSGSVLLLIMVIVLGSGCFGSAPVAGENRVGWIRRLETGSVEFVAAAQLQSDGSPAAHLFEGDSGGACLSKADQAVLVGIAASRARNRKGESLSVFTSVYAHRDWLTLQVEGL